MVRARIRPLDLSLHQAPSDHSLRGTWPLRGCRSPRSSSPWVVASPWERLTPIILPLALGFPAGPSHPILLPSARGFPLHYISLLLALCMVQSFQLPVITCIPAPAASVTSLPNSGNVPRSSDRDPSSPPPLEPGGS